MDNNAKKKSKKKKPLRRAQNWGGRVWPMAVRLLLNLIVVIVLGMMFSALQAVDSVGLRMALSLLIVSGMLLMYLNEGLNAGLGDATNSRACDAALAKGRALEKDDEAGCYHPVKALCAALAAFGVPLLLALYISLTAQDYTYSMQDLPLWLTDTYGARGDMMAPLGAYAQTAGLTLNDWIRMIVRLPEMIYINLFPDPLEMSGMIDRLSPLMILTYPLAYMLGYLLGPRSNRKREKMNRRAKKVAVRRAQKSNLVEELTGEQNNVHYGKKVESDKHKKRELV